MSKKGTKRRMSASSLMAVIEDTPSPSPPPTPPAPQDKLTRKESEWRRYAECAYCGKKKQPIAYTDADVNWEPPGHPDHIDRDVCVVCVAEYEDRIKCCTLVYEAMRQQLVRKDELSERDIDQVLCTTRRNFEVEFDHKSLVKLARKLKVKHHWLKSKRAK